jgi:hypothetical protein
MPLCRLVYVSLSRDPQADFESGLSALLRQARRRNLEAGVTGALVSVGPAFVQAIEGRRDIVTALFDRIYRDPRHSHMEIIDCSTIRTREFGDWTLAYHRVDPHDEAVVRRFGRNGMIDPLALTPEATRLFLLAMTRQSERAAADRAGFSMPALA